MKIDFGLIEGYEAMSAEEKLKAIEELDFTDPELERLRADSKKQKELIDKYTGEISKLKKSSSAELSAAGEKNREYEDALKDLQAKYDELHKASTVSAYATKYLALGYSEDLALATAKAVVEGDMDTVFANAEVFKTNLQKQMKAEAVKATPKPDGKGGINAPKSREDIMKIKDASERQKAIAENIELFTKGE